MPIVLSKSEAETLYKVVKPAAQLAHEREQSSANDLSEIVRLLREGEPLPPKVYGTAIRVLRYAAEDTDDLAFHNACRDLAERLIAEEERTEPRHQLAPARSRATRPGKRP